MVLSSKILLFVRCFSNICVENLFFLRLDVVSGGSLCVLFEVFVNKANPGNEQKHERFMVIRDVTEVSLILVHQHVRR